MPSHTVHAAAHGVEPAHPLQKVRQPQSMCDGMVAVRV
jgi:hypothetical protein